MRQQFRAVALSVIVLWLTGCADDYAPRPSPQANTSVSKPSPPPPPPPPPAPVSTRPPSRSATTGGASKAPAAARPQASSPSAATGDASKRPAAARPQPPSATTPRVSQAQPTPSAGEQSIRLSMGVALPQTGPEGIMMGFSVEYVVTQGEPSRSAEYIWVVERAHGDPVKQRVQMAKQGTLAGFINGWRPQEGPFQTHIEDRSGHRLSASIELDVAGLLP